MASLMVSPPMTSIVLPGDLEKAGWEKLLENKTFRDNLGRVNIFVASHHGRESGYCTEVFEYCDPAIVIISDESKQYETQETNYTQYARGITWNQTEVRKVLTTRSDGKLTITPRQGGFFIQASR